MLIFLKEHIIKVKSILRLLNKELIKKKKINETKNSEL
jgi:hypothetical protein